MHRLRIIKSDGNKEDFDWQKFHHSLLKSQIKPTTIDQLRQLMEPHLYNEIPTKEIYVLTKEFLHRLGEKKGFYLYQLREAIANLDSIAFEKYIAQLLTEWKYTTLWNILVGGRCIEHQVDVVAKKGGKQLMVECKHHHNYHRDSGLGKIMELYARLQDVNQLEGPITYSTEEPVERMHFDQAWLITNTKLSYHAIQYADCKNIILTGWRFGHFLSLEHLSQDVNLYPLTLIGLSTQESAELVPFNFVTTKDILEKKPSGEVYQFIPPEKFNQMKKLAIFLSRQLNN